MSLGEKKIKLKHLAIAGFVCIAAFAGAYGMIEATNQSPFCGETCHEMDPMYVTWKHSNHKNVDCADCHEQPGFTGMVIDGTLTPRIFAYCSSTPMRS